MSKFNEEICVEKEDFKESENLASVTIIRSNTIKLDSGKGKIVKYRVDVKVRDSKDFNVELSRDDAERIFGLYTYYGGNIRSNYDCELWRLLAAQRHQVIQSQNG